MQIATAKLIIYLIVLKFLSEEGLRRPDFNVRLCALSALLYRAAINPTTVNLKSDRVFASSECMTEFLAEATRQLLIFTILPVHPNVSMNSKLLL